MCDKHGIGGSGEYYGDNNAYLGRINVFYHEALGGKYDAGHVLRHKREQKLGQRRRQKAFSTSSSDAQIAF
jgi:hypothetical protein